MQQPLTLEAVLELYKKLSDSRPRIYYGLSDLVEPGVSYVFEATRFHPKWFICHPSDFTNISQQLAGMNIIPIEDYRPKLQGILDVHPT